MLIIGAIIIIFVIILIAVTKLALVTEIYHDDANSAATAGIGQGGAALSSTVLKGWDGIAKPGKHERFRDMALMEEDVVTDEIVRMCWLSLHWQKWAADLTLYKWGETMPDKTSSAGTIHYPYWTEMVMRGENDIKLTPQDTMITSLTKIASTEANSDLAAIFAFSRTKGGSYPGNPAFPWRPNSLIVGDVSENASTADVLTEAWDQSLISSNANTLAYLDPDKTYIVYGAVYVVPVKDKKDMVCKIEATSGESEGCSVSGFGSGDMLGHVSTLYTFDGFKIKGIDSLRARFVSGVASTPHIGVVVQAPQKPGFQ